MKNNRRTFFMSKMNQYFAIYSYDKSEIFCITFYIQKIADQ